ncbi:hypothetical protein [Sphingomonas sp. Leaf10]|uniref:hypothetical protein n=1 Tax=Sphingomonas sp. Leaf10 TaxID=1735676 RepID=UPI0006FB9645|nr:hypothetical protein [Sphingomonas sp. Leaf10]KQM37985.1 hypothetical protein ASE59_11850 [Sphingomonas sp. Leaf10]
MTREERAREWLADYFDQHGKHGGADELRDGRMITMTSITAVNAMLAFADAEAAAMRERAAGAMEALAAEKRAAMHPEGHPMAGGIVDGMLDRAASAYDHAAAAIPALPATGEVE